MNTTLRCIQHWLDRFYYARKWLMNGITWFAMRLYGVEITFAEVKARTYTKIHKDRNLDKTNDVDSLLTEAKARLREAEERRAILTDKCKTLLTMGSFLIAAIGAFLPRTFDFPDVWLKIFFFLGVVCLFNALLVLWVYFDIGSETGMSIEQSLVDLDKENLKKSLVNSYLQVGADKDRRTDFLVDAYQAARFLFLTAFTIFVLLFSINYLFLAEAAQTKH